MTPRTVAEARRQMRGWMLSHGFKRENGACVLPIHKAHLRAGWDEEGGQGWKFLRALPSVNGYSLVFGQASGDREMGANIGQARTVGELRRVFNALRAFRYDRRYRRPLWRYLRRRRDSERRQHREIMSMIGRCKIDCRQQPAAP